MDIPFGPENPQLGITDTTIKVFQGTIKKVSFAKL